MGVRYNPSNGFREQLLVSGYKVCAVTLDICCFLGFAHQDTLTLKSLYAAAQAAGIAVSQKLLRAGLHHPLFGTPYRIPQGKRGQPPLVWTMPDVPRSTPGDV